MSLDAQIAVSHSISIRNGKEGDSCVHLLWGLKAVMGNGKKCRTANCAEFQNMFALSSLLKTSKSFCCELQLIPTPLNRPMFYHFVLRGSVRFNFAEVGLKKCFFNQHLSLKRTRGTRRYSIRFSSLGDFSVKQKRKRY